MEVFLLWHVHHVAGDPVRHFDDDGSFWADEEAGDDVKLLGVYTSREKAIARTASAVTVPGFDKEPDCFHIDTYELDKDCWTEGFITV